MELTKDDFINLKYNRYKNTLEVKKPKRKSVFARHKVITGVLGITAIFIGINLYLIYQFFNILATL